MDSLRCLQRWKSGDFLSGKAAVRVAPDRHIVHRLAAVVNGTTQEAAMQIERGSAPS